MANKYLGSAPGTGLWPDPLRGPWRVVVHFGEVDGQVIPIGMDVRAFKGEPGDPDNPPHARTAWTPLTASTVRQLPVGAVVDEARRNLQELTEWVGSLPTYDQERAKKRAQRRRAGPPVQHGDEHLVHVADLYRRASAANHRSPAKDVWQSLVAEGFQFQSSAEKGQRERVRKWIQEARRRGFIQPTTTETKGKKK